MDLPAWLSSHGLEEYAAVFEENRIGPDVLPSLTDQDLRDLGVQALGDRKRFLAAIAALGAETRAKPARAHAPRDGERRQVTVLFADIAGYTAMSGRLGAEATHKVLNDYFDAADRIVEDYGGSVDKHIGDNVMAVFGAPIAHDNDPERAVRAALAIHRAAKAIALPGGGALGLHVGVACGLVVASATGSESHTEYTVTGEAVNLAARLQGLAGVGQTLVSDAVRAQTAGDFLAVDLGPQTLKGIVRPTPVWRIERERETSEAERATPFVGRRAEVSQCRAIIAEVAATGEGQTILLRGPAGIGKTRLAEEIANAARETGFAVHRGLVLDFGSRRGQGAISALTRSLLGLSSASDEGACASAVDDAIAAGAVAEADRVFVNDLLETPQPPDLRARSDLMDAASRRAGRRALFAQLATWASRAAPQLLLVEDLHWADASTLECLQAVMAAVAENPALLVATTRPEGDPMDGDWRAASLDQPVSIINLGPLRASEAREMAAAYARASEAQLAECLERAAGNPLFLENLLQNALESAAAAAQVPASIHSLVLARMDRLAAGDRRALQAASVFGQRFSLAGLRHLLAAPDYDCAALLRHQLIRAEDADFLFAHALIRDGVYASILSAARSGLHLKAAEWFEESDPALFAEHLGLAGDPRAPKACLAAARSEAAGHRYREAMALLSRGKALATDPADRVALALALGEAAHDAGALQEAQEAFQEALDAAADEEARCRAWLGLAAVKRITDDLPGALRDLDAAQAAAERLGLTAAASRAHFLRGNVLFPLGDIEGCLREHGMALALAREADSAELEAAALGGLADAEYMRGRCDTARQRFAECVEVSRRHGFRRTEVANLPMLAITTFWCGDTAAAERIALDSIAAAQRIRHERAEMIAHHAAYFCCKARGALDSARRCAETAIALAQKLGAPRFEAESECFLAEIDFLQGDRGAAMRRTRRAVEIGRKVGMAYLGPVFLGALVLATDEPAERQAAAEEAEAMLATGSISHNHILFRTFAIDASLQAGDYDEAERHADLLRAYCPEPEMTLVMFEADRGRALARAGRGERGPALATEIRRLVAEGERLDQQMALTALRAAERECEP